MEKAEIMEKKRIAIVTGAAKGIGKAITTRLAGENYFVIAVDVDREAHGLGGLDRGDRLLETAVHAHRLVVVLLEAIEMHREE